MKKALITGITGQDGSYLAELLLEKNYEVHGLVRRGSSINTSRIDHIYGSVHLHYGDLLDEASLINAVAKAEPTEVYNLAAQSHVRVSFDVPEYTAQCVALGADRLIRAVRTACGSGNQVRYYQASSSEMFGGVTDLQDESTPFSPRSPYARAKVYAYHATVAAREELGWHACNGILFNHESPRRDPRFVTRKITQAVARIRAGLQERLTLGNIYARRDWGHAKDYVQAMWQMLQLDNPGDWVVATGTSISVAQFLEKAFRYVGLRWHDHVDFDSRLLRPTEVDSLKGDYLEFHKVSGWEPTYSVDELVDEMMEHDLALAEREKILA